MNMDFGKIIRKQDGQGLVEYTLIVLLVALVFWVAVRTTNVGTALTNSWEQVKSCLTNPASGCTSSSGGSGS